MHGAQQYPRHMTQGQRRPCPLFTWVEQSAVHVMEIDRGRQSKSSLSLTVPVQIYNVTSTRAQQVERVESGHVCSLLLAYIPMQDWCEHLPGVRASLCMYVGQRRSAGLKDPARHMCPLGQLWNACLSVFHTLTKRGSPSENAVPLTVVNDTRSAITVCVVVNEITRCAGYPEARCWEGSRDDV